MATVRLYDGQGRYVLTATIPEPWPTVLRWGCRYFLLAAGVYIEVACFPLQEYEYEQDALGQHLDEEETWRVSTNLQKNSSKSIETGSPPCPSHAVPLSNASNPGSCTG